MSSELATARQQQAALVPANTGLSIFDTGTFEQMGLIASKLASSTLIPESLRTEKKNGQLVPLPPEQVAANCFRIVEQAQRWGMSPFAVIDCASVVHGKLMWEGKLIAAALDAQLGVRLDYEYSGEGEARTVTVSGRFPDEEKIKSVEGSVAKWKTGQWKATDYDQRLAYRGSREWARRYAPGVILGVYSPDEFVDDLRQVHGRVVEQERTHVREQAIDPFAGKNGGVAQEVESVENDPEVAGSSPASPSSTTSSSLPNSADGSPLRPAFVVEVEVKSGDKKDGGKWTGYFVKLSNGERTITATTFSTRIGKLAQSATNSDVLVELEKTDRGYTLKDLQTTQVREETLI